ncbi:MAG: hypothetical protein LBD71_08160 [Treponema sp.]|jgi:hypothetical protein|nr:hypothetical protein [Treponema sp.]
MKTRTGMVLALLCLFSGCATAPADSEIWTMAVSDTANLYYIPATDWKSKQNDIISRLDITYVTEAGRPAVCNISFFGKTKMPEQITAVSFEGDGKIYPLHDVRVLVSRPEKNERRITSAVSIDDLKDALNAESLVLSVVLDKGAFVCGPPKEFVGYKDQFLAKIRE